MKYTFSTSSVTKKAKLRTRWFAALAFLLFFVITGVFASAFSFRSSAVDGANGGGVASAESGIAAQSASYSGDAFTVNRYEATVTINADRTVDFRERLVVTMNQSVGTQFYRSLPIDQGDAYFDVSAKRSYTDGRLSEDSFSVIENPDNGDYIDIVVYGGITANVTWAYEFSYSMRSSEATSNGLGLDVVGGGWTVPLNNVTVTVNFPAAPESCAVYSDEYGVAGKRFIDNESWSADKKTLTLTSVKLPVIYNGYFDDSSAAAVTVVFKLPAGVMSSYAAMLLKSPSFWVVLVVSAIAAVASLFLSGLFKVRHEMITVVSVKPPEGMDPLMMGRIVDGKVDNEDVTSMIYYFADQGYLTIELPGEKEDPILHRTEKPVPDKMPPWQKALLEGLFDKDRRKDTLISDLENKFYTSVDKAKTLLSTRRGAEYESKSVVGACLIALLAVCLYAFVPFFIGKARIGGGYKYWTGLISAFPIAACEYGYFCVEQWRYKKKAGVRRWANIGITAVLALFGVWYTALFARHILTVWEKLFISVGATVCAYFAPKCISRTEKYVETLGKILGFKDFILYTEEEKIKFMLQENPQLYYDVLPYAQVLGVTKEWEGKFKSITIEPPSWCSGEASFSVFDYVLLNSLLRSSFVSAMSRPKPKGGGTFLGGGGSGGHFGGFSGGGHGGGGGGVR